MIDRPIPGPEGVRFAVLLPNARSVALAGVFNEWSATAHPMRRQGSAGVWMIVVPLGAGDHPFMYVVDGQQWLTPPAADDFVPDGFGQLNGLVVVP